MREVSFRRCYLLLCRTNPVLPEVRRPDSACFNVTPQARCLEELRRDSLLRPTVQTHHWIVWLQSAGISLYGLCVSVGRPSGRSRRPFPPIHSMPDCNFKRAEQFAAMAASDALVLDADLTKVICRCSLLPSRPVGTT